MVLFFKDDKVTFLLRYFARIFLFFFSIHFSIGQSQVILKCLSGNNSPKSLESLITCSGISNGSSVKIDSYFNKRTSFDAPSDFVWSSTEIKDDGCVYFKSRGPSSGTWVRKISINTDKVYTLPLGYCGISPPLAPQKYSNATEAFIRGFNHLSVYALKSIIEVPKGDVYVDPDFESKKFLFVPKGVSVQGVSNESTGTSQSSVHWDETDIPVFNFVGSQFSGIQNLNFIFDGYMPTTLPKYSQSAYFNQIGFDTGQFDDPKALQTVIFTINSSNLSFDKLRFYSSFQSSNLELKNKRNFTFAITSLGSDPVPADKGAGLRALSKGNRFTNIYLSDYVMGFLISGQENCLISNVESRRRGDWPTQYDGPPGHVIYVTPPRYMLIGDDGFTFYKSKNVNILNVKEFNEGVFLKREAPSLGTLAYKGVDGGTVKNIISEYPKGILQSGIFLNNITFENLQWSYNGNICEYVNNCLNGSSLTVTIGKEYLNAKIIGNGSAKSSNLSFNNVSLISPNQSIKVRFDGGPESDRNAFNVKIQNFYVKGSQFSLKEEKDAGDTVFSLAMSGSSVGIFYIPMIPEERFRKFFSSVIPVPVRISPNSYNSKFNLVIKGANGAANFHDPELGSFFDESNEENPLRGIAGSHDSELKVSF